MKYKILIIVIAVIFAAGIVGTIWVLNAPKKQFVRIKSGGKTLYTLDLSREPDRTIEIERGGGVNLVEIRRLSRQNLREYGVAEQFGYADRLPASRAGD